LDQPINASISLTGSATLELTSVKPDDGAIVAIVGEKGAVWLGVVSCTHGFVACGKTGLIWMKTPVTLAQPALKNCLIMSHSGGEKEGSKLLVLHIAHSTCGLLQRPTYGMLG
jgi:hypothetical protein